MKKTTIYLIIIVFILSFIIYLLHTEQIGFEQSQFVIYGSLQGKILNRSKPLNNHYVPLEKKLQGKYLYIKFTETNHDDPIEFGTGSITPDKEGRVYQGFMIEPMHFNLQDEIKKIPEGTVIFLLHSIVFNGERRNGATKLTHYISSLPNSIDISSDKFVFGRALREKPEAKSVRLLKEFKLIEVYEKGVIKIKYHNDIFILQPGEKYMKTQKEKIRFGKIQEGYFETKIEIENVGFIDKKKNKHSK